MLGDLYISARPSLLCAAMPPRRVVALALGIAGALGALPACDGGGGDELTVYSGREADLIAPILERFAEETGIDIAFRDGTTADLALQIDTEGDRSPADVFLSQSPGAVAFLDERGRLAPLPDGILDAVPDADRAADGAWVGLTGRVRTLVYNTELVGEADLPASVLDLTDPRYDGMLGIAPGNASFQDFVTGLRGELGEDAALAWLEGIAANDPTTYPNNVSILDAVNRGEVALGLINHYYWFEAAEDDPDQPSALHFFAAGDLGSMLLVTAASVLDTSDQPEDAQRLVEFLLGEEAQRYFAEETLEYPLAAGVEPVEGLFPLDEIVSARLDLRELGSLDRTIELIDEAGLGTD
jgi:iron(III) transport system substrate-binding protein